MRRLLMTAMTAGCFVLAACSGTSTNTAVAQAASIVSTIAAGLAGAAPSIELLMGASSTNATKVANAIADMQAVSKSLSAAASTTAAQPLVSEMETDINAVLAVAATVPECGTPNAPALCLPQDVELSLQAAEVLVPTVETVIGMTVTPAASARAKTLPISQNEAILILQGEAAKSH